MIIKKNLLEKLKKAKCILFDMDGIITDTMPRHCDSWILSFNNFFNIDVTREEIYKREGEKSDKSVKEILIKYKVENIDDKIIKDFLGYKCKMFNNLGDMPLFDGILDALIFLKRNKKLLGLVTGTQRLEIDERLQKNIKEVFDVMITSSEITHGKPHPEPYLTALKKLHIKPEDALVVENAPYGLESAKSAGIEVLIIPTSLSLDHFTKYDYLCIDHKEFYNIVYQLS